MTSDDQLVTYDDQRTAADQAISLHMTSPAAPRPPGQPAAVKVWWLACRSAPRRCPPHLAGRRRGRGTPDRHRAGPAPGAVELPPPLGPGFHSQRRRGPVTVTVTVAGAHSAGKTTFVARLARRLRSDDLEIATVADLGEAALRIGLGILHSHTSTLWIMARGISDEVATWPHIDVLLVDRPVPDALGYYLAALDHRAEAPDPVLLGHLRTLAVQHSSHYDLILRTTLDHEVPLGTDKPRDTNNRYRHLADHHVGQVLTDLAIPHRLLPAEEHDAAIEHAVDFVVGNLGPGPDFTSADTSADTRPDTSPGTGTGAEPVGTHLAPVGAQAPAGVSSDSTASEPYRDTTEPISEPISEVGRDHQR